MTIYFNKSQLTAIYFTLNTGKIYSVGTNKGAIAKKDIKFNEDNPLIGFYGRADD